MAKAIDAYTVWSCHEIPRVLHGEDQLSERWEEFELLNDADWAEVHASIDPRRAAYLLVYGMRMAFLSVRAKNSAGIWQGLMGLVLDDDVLDYRDVLMIATLLYDAAVRLESRPEAAFQRAAVHASPKRRQLLEGFLTAPDFTKSLRSKGLEASGSEEEFIYRWRI